MKGETSKKGRGEREKEIRNGGKSGGKGEKIKGVLSGFTFRQCCVWSCVSSVI